MLVSILSAIVVGVIGYLVALLLDKWMDYGAIFGQVRYRLARWYAREDEGLLQELEVNKESSDYAQRLIEMNETYWSIAAEHFWFTGWVCINCIAGRIVTLAWLILTAPLLNQGADWIGIFVGWIVALSIANWLNTLQ